MLTCNLLIPTKCWGSENGYNTFHLGGGLGAKEDNLFKFKSSFNRNSNNTFVIGRRIFAEEKYHALVQIRESNGDAIGESNFFPQYRA